MLTAGKIVSYKVRKGHCKKVAFQLHYEGHNNRQMEGAGELFLAWNEHAFCE